MTKNKVIEFIGWYGICAVLIAYSLNSLNIISSSSFAYSVLNFSGAIGIAIDAFKDKNYQPVVLNIIWGLIALTSLTKIFL